MTRLMTLHSQFGQSPWLDDLDREMLIGGQLRSLVQAGVRGVTTNPTIFRKAIAGSDAYDGALASLLRSGVSEPARLYDGLTAEDARAAADVLLPVHAASGGEDGYVSVELPPRLAFDAAGSSAAARRLRKAIDRPNLMIKVPGTAAGLPAIEELIAEGINVNVTLLFSVARYREVALAYRRGFERSPRHAEVASVASLFVSRIDGKVDPLLERIGSDEALARRGRAGIASAKLAYQAFKDSFGDDFPGRPQRPLWASTSTKNPAYPDLLYVDNLIGPRTVNTMPRETLKAFEDHGELRGTLESDVGEAQEDLRALQRLGIDMEIIAADLEREGVARFAADYDALLAALRDKAASRSFAAT